ncbi:MAG TPA: prolyl oligopeptidase family serine peptidase [Candidatus Limnocylindrales bacterium]|nr:prolyl oligopeptidase family serine peptidase [Candidatus Limnocylindrales bacterium]
MTTARRRPAGEADGDVTAGAGQATHVRTTGRRPTQRAAPPTQPGRARVTVEALVAVEPPREVRLHPRDRFVAYTSTAAGARQLFLLPFRGGYPVQLTASEKNAADPQWSPDGRRLAYVREDQLHVIEADGGRDVTVTTAAGLKAPRWSPDGGRLAFIARPRGWSQVWLVDAPVPRRGRPARDPKPPVPVPVTPTGVDIEDVVWLADGRTIAVVASRPPHHATAEIHLVDSKSGEERQVAGGPDEWASGPRPLPDGGLLYATDRDGYFQVVRLSADRRERVVLTSGDRDHGELSGAPGFAALPSPDGRRFVHIEIHDGLADLVVAPTEGATPPKRGRGRPPKNRPAIVAAGEGRVVNPWPGVWRACGWTADGAWIVAVGERDTAAQDVWLLPVPDVAPGGSKARQLTTSMPAVLTAAFADERRRPAERLAIRARDGLPLEGTIWRPPTATGKRGAPRVPAVLFAHGGPSAQSLRAFVPIKQLVVEEGFAAVDVDFRGSTGYGRAFRLGNIGEWGHADTFDMIDAARWVLDQPWSDGRLAIYGGSYGGYLVLCALVAEPGLWRAGVDLFGDSEIAESYRHGDRPGRLDLGRQMGSPDDPATTELFRRGSPVYRAERIEAPVLLLHGRKDKRVVPLMTERMVEALEIENKTHEVHWYDDEGHGWEKLENRRDALRRTIGFLKRHVLDEPDPGSAQAE